MRDIEMGAIFAGLLYNMPDILCVKTKVSQKDVSMSEVVSCYLSDTFKAPLSYCDIVMLEYDKVGLS